MTQALATKPQETFNQLRTQLQARADEFSRLAGQYLQPSRLIEIALASTSRQPLLLQCSIPSIVRAVKFCAERGLEPCGSGGVWLVPHRNNKVDPPVHEAIPIVDWRGLVTLARRSGEVKSIEARIVHEADYFAVEFGTEPSIKHTPEFKDDAGAMVAVYAVATLRDGTKQFEVMNRAQVDAIRKRSKAKDSGPWVSDYDQMACKTVVRRICKYLPSDDVRRAIDDEDAIHEGIPQLSEPAEAPAPQPKAVDRVKAKLRASQAQNPERPSGEPPLPPEVDPRQESLFGGDPGPEAA